MDYIPKFMNYGNKNYIKLEPIPEHADSEFKSSNS